VLREDEAPMLRNLIEEILLFFLPFAAFAGWLLFKKRNPFDFAQWSGYKFALAVIGLLLAIASIIAVGLLEGTHRGAYTPARVENGRLIPGEVRN
jgi:hypothetical protein